jgi:protein required for attachment to host cells
MNKTHYIMVADSGLAKIYKSSAALDALQLVYEQANPAGRKIRSELDADRPGIQRNSIGGTHGLGGDSDTHRHESELFARELCNFLQKEHQDGRYDNLMLVAPPHFLGYLRQHLGKECQQILGKTVNKDLVRSSTEDILAHLV